MHVIVSWDIRADSKEWSELNNELRKCLKGYSRAKPLSTLYIVKLNSPEEREYIRSEIIKICRNKPKTINLIISPLIEGDKYSGWLPQPMWEKIRERTEVDYYDLL